MSDIRIHRQIPTMVVLTALAVVCRPATLPATLLLDWTAWDSTWTAGNLGPQSLVVSSTQTITYQGATDPGTSFLFNTPDVLIDTPPGFPFNGTGGAADHYLDLYQGGNLPGLGSTHRFSFTDPVDRLSFTLWDIDADAGGTNNYVDQVTIRVRLNSGGTAAPTGFTIQNPAVVKQVAADTWTGIPFVSSNDNTNNGNLVVEFAMSAIVGLEITYLNSTDMTDPTRPSGDHGIGIYDLRINEIVPEPSGWTLGLAVFCCCLGGGSLRGTRHRLTHC